MRTLKAVKGDIKLDGKKHDDIAKSCWILKFFTTKRCFIIIILALLTSSSGQGWLGHRNNWVGHAQPGPPLPTPLSSGRYLCINECCCLLWKLGRWRCGETYFKGQIGVVIKFCCRKHCVLGRCGGWEDAYFKGQVCVEYGWWMICACLVSFYACAIPTPP